MTTAKTSAGPAPLVDAHALPFLLGVCDAIEEFTAYAVARDPEIFRPDGVDLRFVVERHHYFAMVNNQALYRLFVASREKTQAPARLPAMTENFAPFLVKNWRPRGYWRRKILKGWRGPGWKTKRAAFRTLGAAQVEAEDLAAGKPILFLVVQSKFIRFLLPIAQALGHPYAFVVFEDAQVYAELERQKLPRLHITFDALTRELLKIETFGLLEFFSTHLNTVLSAFAQTQPACIVVPEGNAPLNELFNRAARKMAIPVLCVQQGWSPIVHTGFRNMRYDSMCVWGDGFADILAPFNPAQKFVATGNHLVARRARVPGQNGGPIAFFLQMGGSPLITDAAAAEMLELALWAAKRFPQREIRVREHPGGPLTETQAARLKEAVNLRLMPAHAASLEQVMAGLDIAVSIFSTTLLEAAACGVIPLIINVAGLAHYSPDIARDGAGVEVRNFADAQNALVRLAEDPEYSSSIAAGLEAVGTRYFAAGQQDALAAIVAEITRLRTGAAALK